MWVQDEIDGNYVPDDGNVIDQIPRVEIRMDVHCNDIALEVRVEFRVAVHIPLTQPNAQLKGLIPLDAVSGGEDVPVVYESAGTHVHIVIPFLLEHRCLPRVLAKFGVTVLLHELVDAAVNTITVLNATGASAEGVEGGGRGTLVGFQVTAHLVQAAVDTWGRPQVWLAIVGKFSAVDVVADPLTMTMHVEGRILRVVNSIGGEPQAMQRRMPDPSSVMQRGGKTAELLV